MSANPGVVVITGGSAGVGRAIARRFARSGTSIAVLARGCRGLDATVDELRAAGVDARGISIDVADPEAVEEAADEVERELGPIDVWVNNAMTTVFGSFLDLTPQEYRRVTDVTYHGYVWGTRAALRRMRTRDRGVILQVSSALAFRAIPLQSAYCGAKHGIRALTESLRAELIHTGCKVHLGMVHLPGVNTPQFSWCRSKMDRRAQPVPPIFEPELAAEAVYHAVTRQQRDVYVGFPTVQTIVGEQLAPGIMDHVLARRAFDGQMTHEPEPAQRDDNLFSPIEGDHGARGRFSHRARRRDTFTEIAVPLGASGLRALTAAAIGGVLWLGARLLRSRAANARRGRLGR